MMVRTRHSFSPFSLLRYTVKPLFPRNLHSQLYTSLASATATAAATESSLETPSAPPHHHHPWPEWVAFIERLKSQGYFPKMSSSAKGEGTELVYREMNLLKDPCLSFARDRYDIFRSLSKGDIHTIVESGCPKLLRKVVNSAKRLRVYVELQEKNACNSCSLRGSCDRAYVMLEESEGGARTVDLMRLLLSYALDPVVISGAVKPRGVEQVELSARRLLSMLIDLSEASDRPAPIGPSKKLSYKKQQSVNPMNAMVSQNVEKKNGDWTCPKCSFMNFTRNFRCWKCNGEGPKWDGADIQIKKGDWNCLQCGCINFASRKNCFRCKDPLPPRTLNPGEWECPKCDFLNFRRNITCLKCGSERCKEAAVCKRI